MMWHPAAQLVGMATGSQVYLQCWEYGVTRYLCLPWHSIKLLAGCRLHVLLLGLLDIPIWCTH
jgi:hypothetical protein